MSLFQIPISQCLCSQEQNIYLELPGYKYAIKCKYCGEFYSFSPKGELTKKTLDFKVGASFIYPHIKYIENIRIFYVKELSFFEYVCDVIGDMYVLTIKGIIK